jgi:hypothetical protein
MVPIMEHIAMAFGLGGDNNGGVFFLKPDSDGDGDGIYPFVAAIAYSSTYLP